MYDPDGTEEGIRQPFKPIEVLSSEAFAKGTHSVQSEAPESVSNRAQSPNYASSKQSSGNAKLWSIVIIVFFSAILVAALYSTSLLWKPGVVIAMSSKLRALLEPAKVVSDCNGRGVWTTSGGCYCDIAWQGSSCDLWVDILRPAGAVRPKSVLLVVEDFSSFDVRHENAINYVALASFLARSGYTIEVLIVGPKSRNFGELQSLCAEKAIRLVWLLNDELHFDSGKGSRTSYLVMRHILNESHLRRFVWEIIMFAGSHGVGHQTISSQRQGLLCIGSHFVILQDTLTPLRRAQLTNGSTSTLVLDKDLLGLDYLQQRATELADTIVFTSKAYLDVAMEQGWRISQHVHILPHLVLSMATERSKVERAEELIPARQTRVTEFVYTGPLNVVGGLNVFLDAIDDLSGRDQGAHRRVFHERQLEITFFGWNDVINDESSLTAEHYIKMRANGWNDRVKWSVHSELHLDKMVKYLTEPGKGRIVVIPAIGDTSPFFLHQALRAGVPVIASDLKSTREIVHLQDRHAVLFPANDTVAMAKSMLDAIEHGVLLGRPQNTTQQYESQWRQLLAEIEAHPLAPCPTINFYPPSPRPGVEHFGSQSTSNPVLVSIVLTHYNGNKLLQRAIASIEAQSLPSLDYEVILVSDESTEVESQRFLDELARRWWQGRGWQVLRQPNRHLGAARNTGARHARGKYVLFMDDDDVARPEQLEIMLRVAEISGADVVTTGHDLFVEGGPVTAKSITVRHIPLGPAMNAGIFSNVFGDSNMLVRRQFFLKAGGFIEEHEAGIEKYEFLARVASRGNHLEACVEPLHWSPQHSDTMSLATDLKASQVRILQAYLEVYSRLPRLTQSLLHHVQASFNIDQGSMLKYSLANTTTTKVTPTTTTDTLLTTHGKDATLILTAAVTQAKASTALGTFSALQTNATDFSNAPQSSASSTCPRRSHPRQAPYNHSSTHSTCWLTQTRYTTIRRTARATTHTITITPTVTGDAFMSAFTAISTKRLIIPERVFATGPSSIVAVTSIIFTDVPPPRAPLAINAEYAPGGEYVAVLFDRPVNVEVGRRLRCDHFLVMQPKHVPNGAFLGARPEDCSLLFVSALEMRVSVDSRYCRRDPHNSLQPGRLLVFREGTLSNVDSLNRAYVSGTIDVAAPADPEAPMVIIDAPSMVGACDKVISVDLSRSLGAAGRPFVDAHFDFQTTVNGNSDVALTSETPLREFLHNAAIEVIRSGRLSFTIPTTLLSDFTAYTFSFTLWNGFGLGGTGYATVSKVANRYVPSVQIEGPTRVHEDEVVQLQGLLPATVCGMPYTMSTNWSVISGPKQVVIQEASEPYVILPPRTLLPGVYVFGWRLVVTVPHQKQGSSLSSPQAPDRPRVDRNPADNATYLFTHSLTVLPSSARLEIVGGSRLIGYEESTRLLVKIVNGNLANYHLEWTCTEEDRESPCLDISGKEIDLTMAGSDWRLEGPSVPRGSNWQFTVTARHQTSSSIVLTDWVVIVVSQLQARALRVQLTVEKPLVSALESHLRMVATVSPPPSPESASSTTNLTYHWESLAYCNGQPYAVEASQGGAVTHHSDSYLDYYEVIPSLLLPGAAYCYRVAVTGAGNALGWAFRVIKAREPPTSGYCELTSPTVAVALTGRFTAACYGWVGLRIRYLFKLRTFSGDALPLGPPTALSQLSFSTDVGHFDLEVDVIDGGTLLVTTVAVSRISARPGEISKEAFLAEELTRFERTKNARLGHEILALTASPSTAYAFTSGGRVVMMAAERVGAQSSPPNIHLPDANGELSLGRILTLVETLTQSTHISADDTGPYFLDYLLRLAPPKLPVDLRPLFLRILLRLTQGMSLDKLEAGTCFASTKVVKILRLLELIFDNPREGAGASFIVHEIKDILESCLQRTMYCDELTMSDEGWTPAPMPSTGEITSKTRTRQSLPTATAMNGGAAVANFGKMSCHRVLLSSGNRKVRAVRKLFPPTSSARGSDVKAPLADASLPVTEGGEESPDPTQQLDGLIDEWDGEPFTWYGDKQSIEFGLIDTRNVTQTMHLCGFTLPDLRGMAFPGSPCLGYRCSLTYANLMRNASIDTFVLELSLRNASQTLTPWFRTRHMSFILPLSPVFQGRLARGARPRCVWYDRATNPMTSAWSDEGCRVLSFNTTHVQCACSHLTEFAIMMEEAKLMPSLSILLVVSSLGALAGAALFFWLLRKWIRSHSKMGPDPRHWKASGSTIGPGPGSSHSRSTIAMSSSGERLGSTRSGSTFALGDIRRVIRRPAAHGNAPLRNAQSAIWTRHDEEALRRERIKQILRPTQDSEDRRDA